MAKKKSPETINEDRLDLSYESTKNCPRCGLKMPIHLNNLIKLGKYDVNINGCGSVICK